MIKTKRKPIREGDQFKSKSGVVWQVTEVGRFGNPHWVVSVPDRTRQTILHRATLDNMERIIQ